MKHCPLLLTATLLATLLAPTRAEAQEEIGKYLSPSVCLGATEDAMGSRLREYRGVILGTPKASRAPIGTVRYDKEGLPWLKTSVGTWKTFAKKECDGGPGYPCELTGEPPAEKGNDDMDDAAEFPPRLGWLEVRMATTSELLPPLLQSMRALQCKLENVCALTAASLNTPDDETVDIETPGCVKETLPVLKACVPDKEGTVPQTTVETVLSECASMRQTIVAREQEVLKLLVAYDAAHRSLRQFLGLLETFTVDIRSTLLGPMWEAVRAFHALGRVPCFSSQCEQ